MPWTAFRSCVAGGASGRMKTGYHIAGDGSPVSRVGLTIQKAMGVSLDSWGKGSMEIHQPYTELLGVRAVTFCREDLETHSQLIAAAYRSLVRMAAFGSCRVAAAVSCLVFHHLPPAADPPPAAQIKPRQDKLRDMGGALKAITDETKKGRNRLGQCRHPQRPDHQGPLAAIC